MKSLFIMMSLVLFSVQSFATDDMSRDQIIAEAEKTAISHFDMMLWDFRHRVWTRGTFWVGASNLAAVSKSPVLLKALKKHAETRGVRVGVGVLDRHDKKDPHHADDMCSAQAFLDYYVKTKNETVIKDTLERVNEASSYILSAEGSEKAARFNELGTHDGLTWSWIDALFMAAPLHARLTQVTGDPAYLKSMFVEWKRVSDNLYDKDEHLYYRDKNFLSRKSRHKKPVFWSRGNGWVMGAFANTLRYVPQDHPERGWLVNQFKEMSLKLASLQRDDGTWSPSLLDYEHFPYSELSGTSFFCFGMAWGVNNGILEEKLFRPIIEKAWAAMLAARNDKYELGYIQGVGAEPAPVNVNSYRSSYGEGAFIMAAVELSKMAPVKRLGPPALKAK